MTFKLSCVLCRKYTKHAPFCKKCRRYFIYEEDLDIYRRRDGIRGYLTQNQLVDTCVALFPEYHVFQEVGFPELFSVKNSVLRFDIMIPELQLLIEYQGDSHFHFIKYIHHNMGSFLKTQLHDQMKKDYSSIQGWYLLEFTSKDRVWHHDDVKAKIDSFLEDSNAKIISPVIDVQNAAIERSGILSSQNGTPQ